MRLPLKISALLAMLLLAFSLGASGAGAQDEAVEEFDPAELEGIQHGVARYYSPDFSAMMDSVGTPGAEPEMPTGVMSAGALVLEFDSDDNAEKALERVEQEITSEEAGMTAHMEEIDLDLGDNSISYSGSEEMEGMQMETVVTLVQKDNYAYMVFVGGSDVDVQSLTTDLANTLIDNDGSGEGELSDDGTSTGGLWDKFPAADDEAIAGLTASDQVIYPVPESEEEA
jgi:hypothetical protein